MLEKNYPADTELEFLNRFKSSAINSLKRYRRREFAPVPDQAPSKNFDLSDMVDQLPDKSRAVVKWLLRGYKQKEIAVFMDISPATVSRIKKRAYKKLKRAMEG